MLPVCGKFQMTIQASQWDPDVRFAVAKKIVERAADFGIPAHDIVVDPLVHARGRFGRCGAAGLYLGATFCAMSLE